MTLYSDTVVVLCFSWLVSKFPWDYLHLLGMVDYVYCHSLHPLKLKHCKARGVHSVF